MMKQFKRKKADTTDLRCRDCTESYDWHEPDYYGKPFLCRCQHYKAGKFSKFLRDRACELFAPRQ